MNGNRIITDDFSNPESRRRYEAPVDGEHVDAQCGGCSFFAPFDADYGLCCHPASEHHLETVFEHFSCSRLVDEGWGPHSFTRDVEHQCQCGGESIYQTMGTIIMLLDRDDLDHELRSHLRALRQYVDDARKT